LAETLGAFLMGGSADLMQVIRLHKPHRLLA